MQMTGLFYIILAVIADVIANVCLKKSNGFASKKYGFASLALIGVAFLLMAQALVTLDLSIAYAVWGALGILLTTCVDKALCRHRHHDQRHSAFKNGITAPSLLCQSSCPQSLIFGGFL